MIAPKINGHAMQEVYWDDTDKCGNWVSSFNSGLLVVRVFQMTTSECSYRIFYDGTLLNNSNEEYESSPQAAADAAMDFLCKMQNLLTNLGFAWKSRHYD